MKRDTKKILADIVLIVLVCTYNNMFIMALSWVVLHELAHILVSLYFDCKFYNIKFHVFGVNVKLLELDTLSDYKKIIIYLSGPIMNIFLVAVLFLISKNYDYEFIKTSISLNIGLAIFNLLPAYPLDGSRILEIILTKKILYKKAQKLLSYISYFIAIVFILIAIIMFIFLHKVNITMVIGAIIIIYITKIEQSTTMYITMGNLVKKRKKLLRNKYIDTKVLSVYYKQGLVNVLALVDRNKFNVFYILDDDLKLLYILNEDELIESLKMYGNITLEEYIHEKKTK